MTSPAMAAPGRTSAAAMRRSLHDEAEKADAALEHQQVAIGQEGAVGGVDAVGPDDGEAAAVAAAEHIGGEIAVRRRRSPSVISRVEPATGEAAGAMHTASSDSLVRRCVSQSGMVTSRAGPPGRPSTTSKSATRVRFSKPTRTAATVAVAHDRRHRLGVAGIGAGQVGALANSGSARRRRRPARAAGRPRRRCSWPEMKLPRSETKASFWSGPVKPRPDRPPKSAGVRCICDAAAPDQAVDPFARRLAPLKLVDRDAR